MSSQLDQALLKHRNSIDQPVIVVIGTPLNPKIEQHDFVEKGGTVAQHLEKYDLVTVPKLVLYNSEPLLEIDWNTTTLESGDVLTLVSEPGEPFTIAMIVMASISLLVTAYSLYTMLTQDVPSPGERGDSSNYSISYRANNPRPGQPMPVVYGEYKTYPDLAGQFRVYNDNEQILYQLFDVTRGEVETITADDIFFDETPLTSFTDFQMEHLQPGEKSDLFPAGVVDPGIGDIELIEKDIPTQAFTINDESTPISYISFSLSAPQGVYRVDKKGRYDSWNGTNYNLQYRPTGGNAAWTTHVGVIWSSLGVPVNQTSTYPVTPGLVYEARITRTNPGRSYQTNESNQLIWTQLLGIRAGENTKETTRIALKIRASSTLGNATLTKMNVIVKRKIPVWTGSAWTAPQHTKLAAWAFADMARADYGGRTRDALIDLDQLLALAAEGAEYNGVHDNKLTLWEALNSAARPMFGRAVQLPGGIYSVVQDLENQPPVMLFNSRNTVANSYGVEFNVPTDDEDVNFVRVSFFNAAESYRETSVDCVPYGVQKNVPYEVTIRGVTSAAAAYEIGIRMANESKYRRKRVIWDATLDAMIPQYGDVVRVGNYVTGLEQNIRALNGEVRSHSGTTLTVFEDLSTLVGVPGLECVLMNITGTPFYAGACSVPGPNTISVVGSIPQSLLVYGDDFQGPKYCVGEGSAFLESVKITKVSRQDEHLFRLEGIVDVAGAYAGDEPPAYTPLDPPVDRSPKITNLIATLYGSDDNIKVRMTWVGDFCDYYIVDFAKSGAPNDWILLGKPTEPNINAMIPQEDGLTLRVRGVSLLIGKPALAYVDVLSRTITYPGVYNLRPVSPFSSDRVHVQWDALPRGRFARVKFIFLGEVVKQQRVDETTDDAFITVDEVAARFGQSIEGALFPAVGCRNATVRMHGMALVQGVWQESPEYTEIELRNEPMVGLRQLEYRELFTSVSLSFSWPDPAPGGVFVHLSQQAGFVPNQSNLVFFGNSNSVTLTDVLEYPASYYISVAGMDVWGPDDLVYSPQTLIETTQSENDYVLPPITDSLLHPDLSSRIDEIDGGQSAGFSTGLLKQWTVKIDPGGAENYVSGFGLAVDVPEQGPATSEFLVLADRFGVASPGANTFSFIVEDGQVRMHGARIRNGSIKNAAIQNAAVDTLQIAGEAVTAQYTSTSGYASSNENWLTVCSIPIEVVSGGLRLDWAIARDMAPATNTSIDFDRMVRVTIDNIQQAEPFGIHICDHWRADGFNYWWPDEGYSGFVLTTASVGSHTARLQIRSEHPDGRVHSIQGAQLTLTEVKR